MFAFFSIEYDISEKKLTKMDIYNGWEVCAFDVAEFIDWKQTQTSPKMTEIDSGLEE